MSISFKEFEKEAWEDKAPRYNDTWGTVTSQVVDPILEEISTSKKIKLLDIGCGPGHLCGKAVLKGVEAHGCDYSLNMIEIAKAFYPSVDFQWQDAEALTYQNGSFDVIVMNYLLLHVEDQQKTLLEAKRVLKAGGKIIYSNWLPPHSSPGLELMFNAIKEYADMSVIPPAQDIFMFSDPDFADSFFKHNGFTKVAVRKLGTFWQVSDSQKFFQAVQAGTRIGGMIDLQQDEIKEKIKSKILNDIEKFKTSEGYIVPTPSVIVSASLAA